jgi:hypothetical protein
MATNLIPLPATGSAISFGKVNQAFAPPGGVGGVAGVGYTPGSTGNAPGGGQNIKLSAVLGNNATYGIGQTAGTPIKFSATFGGKLGPNSS